RAKAYLEKNASVADSRLYNRLAGQMAQKPETIKDGEALARRAVELARREIAAPREPKPSFQTEREWKDQLDGGLGECLDTLGVVLLKINRQDEALKTLEEAVARTKSASPEVNEHYARALIISGATRAVLEKIPAFISQGHSTATIKAILKEAYIKEKGSDSGWTDTLTGLENAAREKLRAELNRWILDLPAPAFTLNDLEDGTLSLADFKGKTVILDFWATWCGPCQASFPGMKGIVEKYRDDPQVKALFINSWERAEDKKKNAADFISANSYPFQVLLDSNDTVIDAYKVDGIPTKFVIDKNGRIRFKSVGYSGSTDTLMAEISLMIEMVR
ncbi:MAG: redoxin domain-containing protein, partial [Candidatus Aminicenantes bacterium]|nr:redoxin domain-containing protein [Candidatus Aminicenantes bacterium]